MVHYRRNLLPGGTFFFTAALANRRSGFLVDHISVLRSVFHTVKQSYPFHIEAIVILPDHLHTIWTLPEGDSNYPLRWQSLKSGFAKILVDKGIPLRYRRDGSIILWQRRYWEHTIRDDRDYANHIDYIHYNPVKHGYVTRVKDWPHSSFHRYVRNGTLPGHWGSGGQELNTGERE